MSKVGKGLQANGKIDTQGNQAFSVPMNAKGRAFIKLFHEFANTKRVKIRKKGRGRNRTGWGDVRLGEADWIAIYLDDAQYDAFRREYYRKVYELERKLDRVQGERNQLEIDNDKLKDKLDDAKFTNVQELQRKIAELQAKLDDVASIVS